MSRALRLVLILVLAVAAASCKGGKGAATPGPSTEPSSTPTSESLADFQLVGSTQHAFVGIGPGIDTTGAPAVTSTPFDTSTPAPSGSFSTPGQSGVLRIRLDDASDSLKSNCAAARDETINVFWTNMTQFDSELLTSDLEAALEGKTVGVVGRLFMGSEGTDLIGEATPSPSETPGATANPRCILIADQIGTSTGSLPTEEPAATRFRTARPTVAPTATPSPTPTATPHHTATPTPTATVSPTPTST